MKLLRASWLLPIEAPPIPGGAVVVDGETIRAVGTAAELARQWPISERHDLDGCALLPALVNGHAHLELSCLPVPRFGADFVSWLSGVIDAKRHADARQWGEAVDAGATECLHGGQGVVADVVSLVGAAAAYPSSGPRVLAFPEVIAPRPDGLHSGLERAREVAAAVGQGDGAGVYGFAPHAPYTVCGEGYDRCEDLTGSRDWRWMTHLAESRDEVEFCVHGTGAIRERLYAQLVAEPPDPPGCHPLDWFAREGWLSRRSILVHGVHLSSSHLEAILAAGAGIVLCPRSNRNLGVGIAGGRALLDAGIAVGLGTDSVLSAGSLDLWQDVVAAVEDYGWSPQEAVRAATLGSARVLGIDGEVGRLDSGLRADLVAVSVVPGADPWEAVLSAPVVRAMWLGGTLRRPLG
jgi:cytosine/adenosine deaminase-related metal-dependent hydrolase